MIGHDTDKTDFSDVHGAMQSTTAAKADFSDVQSQVDSTVDKATNYTVAADDNLSKIAKRFYERANEWKKIFDAHRDQLSDPDRIQPGQILKISTPS